jgi:antitoxin component of MazEF toxin-antitoxin module
MQTTLFRNGGSQAMRIPAEYRFAGDTVDVEWSDALQALIVRNSRRDRMAPFFEYLATRPVPTGPLPYPVDADGRFDIVEFIRLTELED